MKRRLALAFALLAPFGAPMAHAQHTGQGGTPPGGQHQGGQHAGQRPGADRHQGGQHGGQTPAGQQGVRRTAADTAAACRRPRAAQHAVCRAWLARQRGDTAFAAMQQRGQRVMGVNQYTSTHRFDELPDGGRIELQRDGDDAVEIVQIRRHFAEIASNFADGNFTAPGAVHASDVPGTAVMAAKRPLITYTMEILARGAALRIASADSEAVAAIHQFLEFQRREHGTGQRP
ncbi:MAG: hypothetical protein HYR48_01230 [Gemmatimonadetes bacterium]|nr:hypothetical protein [Gemmatimonadota bacterium]